MIDTQNVRNTFECFQKSSFENRELIIENLCEKIAESRPAID